MLYSESLPRTNNYIEGFHNAIQWTIKSAPTLCSFIEILKKEENIRRTKIGHFDRGDEFVQKLTSRKVDNNIFRLVQKYNADDKETFLYGIAKAMKLF